MTFPAPPRPRSNLIRVTLPFPPSANRYWRTTRDGRTYVSAEAKQFKTHVALLCSRCRPLEGDVRLTLAFFRPAKRGDLSNRIKILEDALIGFAYADDKQVAHIDAERFEDKANPRVEVMVEPYGVCVAATGGTE